LLVFGKKIDEQIDFAQGQHVVAERLGQLRLGGPDIAKWVTGLPRSTIPCLLGFQLLETPTSADSLYIVTDGGDNASHASDDEVARQLTSTGVRLFVSLVLDVSGHRHIRLEELNRREPPLDELVRKSGGEIIQPFVDGFPSTPADGERIANTVNLFHNWMVHNYRIEIELPVPTDKARTWELRLAPERKDQWKGVRITYPTELAPCKP
jgi:hypothetical protein